MMASFSNLSQCIIHESCEPVLAKLVQEMIEYLDSLGKPAEAIVPALQLKLIGILNLDYTLSLKTMSCALLTLLCHSNPDLKVLLVKKDILKPVWNICTRVCRDGLPAPTSTSHKRLLQYLEQTVILLRKLAYGEAHNQFQILKAGLIKLLLQMADLQNSYFYTFQPEATSFLHSFTKDKDLIGKVSPLEEEEREAILSQYLRCDSKNILVSAKSFVVELYDTTHESNDIDIQDELLKQGLAWPEVKPLTINQKVTEKEVLQNGVEYKEDVPESWLDLRVSHVISPQYFLAHVGGEETVSKIEHVQRILSEQVDSKGIQLKKPPEPGQFVCVNVEGRGYCRGQILHVQGEYCKVYTLDFGVVCKSHWNTMYYLTKDMNLGRIPPQASLCRLKGVGPTPISVPLLVNILSTLCNLCQDKYVLGGALLDDGGMEVILPLIKVPDPKVSVKALDVLINLGKQHSLREKMGSLGGVQWMIDIFQSYQVGDIDNLDDEILRKCLQTLNNLLYGNSVNKKIFAELNGLPVLLSLHSSLEDGDVKSKLLQVLRTFTGNVNLRHNTGKNIPGRARDRVKKNNVETDHTSILDQSLSPIQDQKRYSRRRSSSRSGRRDRNGGRGSSSQDRPGRGSDRESDMDRKPALGSISRNRLLEESSSDDEDYDTSSRVYSSGDEGGLPVMEMSDPCKPVNTATLYEVNEANYYLFGQKVPFKQDDLHELRTNRDISKVTMTILKKLVCGFMNQGDGGHIYFGIDSEGVVCGVRVTRDERDRLRIGVDRLMMTFIPTVSHSMFEMVYSAVVSSEGQSSGQAREPITDLCVLEIKLAKTCDIFVTSEQKCFLREGGRTRLLNTQEIRELIIYREEKKYLAELERVVELDRTLKVHLANQGGTKQLQV